VRGGLWERKFGSDLREMETNTHPLSWMLGRDCLEEGLRDGDKAK
jgi:hypothetical protein